MTNNFNTNLSTRLGTDRTLQQQQQHKKDRLMQSPRDLARRLIISMTTKKNKLPILNGTEKKPTLKVAGHFGFKLLLLPLLLAGLTYDGHNILYKHLSVKN